ncbi:TPA: hypothetical protein ACW7QV_003373 [Citrobacter braakii]|uniref:DUF4282 domain-containing protein n=1 Tax=Citrobacter braakii TaxID=57706 RepID=A0AAD1L4J9_CITBR|nr:hypothetical protein KAM621c_23960 [Citrobacter braakii]HEE0062765.1 hypothetical protein [Citrobacter braakii]HEE9823274.1 hypothetical protein [Citrobacter braakii]
MADGDFKKFATFTSLITPQLVTVSYWLISLLIIAGGTWLGTAGSIASMIIALVVVRICFELVMISFKNNEYLRRICEALEAKTKE